MPTPTSKAAWTVPVALSLGPACIDNVSGLRQSERCLRISMYIQVFWWKNSSVYLNASLGVNRLITLRVVIIHNLFRFSHKFSSMSINWCPVRFGFGLSHPEVICLLWVLAHVSPSWKAQACILSRKSIECVVTASWKLVFIPQLQQEQVLQSEGHTLAECESSEYVQHILSKWMWSKMVHS